ncbi:beta-2-microglobulin isoform X1 [Takifugu flavidus]|nr:beta-2-microglobulin isoform X1 [Takifugu flavidus]
MTQGRRNQEEECNLFCSSAKETITSFRFIFQEAEVGSRLGSVACDRRTLMQMKMKLFLLSCLALVCYAENTKHTPPKVQVYSRNPGEFGQKNVLICHVSGFHPPDITIQLMKGEEELKDANQTDLAFKEDWHFHLTKSVFFTPQHEEAYICKVTHGNKVSKYTWETNM